MRGGKVRHPVAPKPSNGFWWNLECRAASQMCSHTEIHIALWQRGWSGRIASLPLSGFFPCLLFVSCSRPQLTPLDRFWRFIHLSPPLDNIRVMVIVCRLRGEYYQNCCVLDCVTQCSQSKYTYMSSSYRSNRLGLSHWDPYAVRRGGCLELYYCNMVEWFWCDSSLVSTTNWFPSVLWHCWFGHLACKNRPRNDQLCVEWDVKP